MKKEKTEFMSKRIATDQDLSKALDKNKSIPSVLSVPVKKRKSSGSDEEQAVEEPKKSKKRQKKH